MHQPSLPPPWHALHFLPTSVPSVLDIGCGAGEALQWAFELGIPSLYGVDINPAAAQAARERLRQVPGCQIIHGSADELPWKNETIEAALCCEVLEHVPRELRRVVIREAYRVLRPGAPLVISVPADGVFSFLDPANVRLTLPFLFRLAARLLGGEGRDAGYRGQKHGLVWHHHFSLEEIGALLHPYFRIERIRWRGFLLVPICSWLAFPFYRLHAPEHPVMTLIRRVESWEMSLDLGERLGYDIVLAARRMELPPP